MRRRVLVLGGGDVGSAVAHRLFNAGLHVLISERPGSAHARRGMAFTDALFDGSARLDGVEARWQADVEGVIACWNTAQHIPIVTLPESELLAQLAFDVLKNTVLLPVDILTPQEETGPAIDPALELRRPRSPVLTEPPAPAGPESQSDSLTAPGARDSIP